MNTGFFGPFWKTFHQQHLRRSGVQANSVSLFILEKVTLWPPSSPKLPQVIPASSTEGLSGGGRRRRRGLAILLGRFQPEKTTRDIPHPTTHPLPVATKASSVSKEFVGICTAPHPCRVASTFALKHTEKRGSLFPSFPPRSR